MDFSSNNVKDQAKKINEMSDDDLRRATYGMPNMPGMPPGGISPEILKNYSKMISGMDEAQLKNMADMAKNMGYNPMGGMPNMYNNPTYNPPPTASSAPKPKQNKEDDPFSKPEDQRKFDSVNDIKNKANDFFKDKNYSKASER